MAIGRAGFLQALFVLVLLSGCARSPLARQVTPDEAQGLRLYEENVKRPAAETLTDADIQALIRDNAAPDAQADGLVFGVVDDRGSRVFAAGTLGDDTDRKVDGDTPFKIGSITKVFTAILLQDMVDRGEMKLDDPVQKYLPPSATMPTRNGKQITLFDLATHTSGLPREGGIATPEQLYGYLSHLRLTRDPGSQYEYSNLGVGLLGHVISLKSGKPYETLVVQRICTPLGMDSTRITLTPDLRTRVARGHAFPGRPVKDGEWHGPLEGCGALFSTTNDLLKFVAANAGICPSPLTPLLQRTWAVHTLPSGRSGRLVWMDDGDIICHGGNTSGFTSDIAFNPAKRRGIVSLANVTVCRIRAVWKPLLNQKSYRPARTTTLSTDRLDDYVGTYQYADDSACVVRRQGDHLLFQWWHGRVWHSLPNVRTEGFPLSASVFYNQLWDTPVRFEDFDAAGRPARFTLKFPARTITWNRISDRPASQNPPHIEPAVYDRYVGQYRHRLLGLIPVGQKLNIYVTKDQLGTHLMGYLSGSDHSELFPASESTVISPDLDGAWLTFSRRGTESGGSAGVVVHFQGNDIRAARVSDRPETPPGR